MQKAKGREFIILMAALMSAVALPIDSLIPALEVIGKDLQVRHANEPQYIISFIFLGTALGELLWGPLSDAFGRKRIIYGTLCLFMLGSLICTFSHTLPVMLAGRFVQGLGTAGPYVCCMAIIRDKFEGRLMARIMSLVMMVFILIPIITPALGQLLLYWTTWPALFISYAVFAAVILAWVYFRLDESLAPENRMPIEARAYWHGVRYVLGNKTSMVYTFCTAFTFAGLIGYLNSAAQIYQDRFHAGDMFVVYFGMLALGFGISSLINARLVERLGMHFLCVRTTVAMIVFSVLFLILNALLTVVLWMFLLYAGLMLFCFGFLFGNLNALAMQPMGHIAGLASALIGSISSMIAIAIGTFIGQLYDTSLVPIAGGFALLSSASLILMLWEQAGSQSPQD